MSRIFISYRRDDSDIWADRLAADLRPHFGGRLFMDIRDIRPGMPWDKVLDEALSDAAVLLVVIGPGWLNATDKQGRRRLDNPRDLVRQEVAEALRRAGVLVFPLLVKSADMPAEEDLPEPLAPLVLRQAHTLTVTHWAYDIARLVEILKGLPGFSGDRAVRDEPAPHTPQAAQERQRASERFADRTESAAEAEEAREQTEEQTPGDAPAVADRTAEEREGAARHRDEEARRMVAAEAERKAEEERRREADEAARRAAAEEARRQAEEESRRQAEQEARRKAEAEAQRRAAEAAQTKAAEEARRKAEEESRRKAEAEAQRKAAEEAARKAEEERRRKDEEARRIAAAEAEGKALEERRLKIEEGARRDADAAHRRGRDDQPERGAASAAAGGPADTVAERSGVQRRSLSSPLWWVGALLVVLGISVTAIYIHANRKPELTGQRETAKPDTGDDGPAPVAHGETPPPAPEVLPSVPPKPAVVQPHLPPRTKPTPKAEPAPISAAYKPGETFKDCSDCPEMVVVPAGRFTMGSPKTERDRSRSEGPMHEVAISRPFALGKYEVTRGEFRKFVDETKRDMGNSCWQDKRITPSDEHPVVCVSWNDAGAYAKWLADRTGKPYRLSSEAEWEYAARARTSTAYFWGDDEKGACEYANVSWCGTNGPSRPGQFKPNAFGLFDMLGNVPEWVEDCYNDSYTGAPADGSAWGSGDCGDRVNRGGGWFDKSRVVRSAVRDRYVSYDRKYVVGLRVARTLR